jgi:hypothetical protein|tara:strand:- start:428 stop:574 length:147 start_codon:yes stop_codon:yes gene_type:complete
MKLDRYNPRHMVALQEAYKVAVEKGLEGEEKKSFIEKTAKKILNNTAY